MPAPVQQKILIEEIKEDVVVLKNGDLRGVLMTSSVNFYLKSSDEQSSLIMKFQNFLNSLDFPVQILMLSRHLNIEEYLAYIEQKKQEQANELLRIQVSEYLDFIKGLVQIGSIMDQSFFVVVPLAKVEGKEGSLVKKLGLFKKPAADQGTKSFDELKNQLWQRLDYVANGLAALGLKAAPLNAEELVQLFHRLYNMGTKNVSAATAK